MHPLDRLRLYAATVTLAGAVLILAATGLGWVEHKDGGLVVLGSLILVLQAADTLADLIDRG